MRRVCERVSNVLTSSAAALTHWSDAITQLSSQSHSLSAAGHGRRSLSGCPSARVTRGSRWSAWRRSPQTRISRTTAEGTRSPCTSWAAEVRHCPTDRGPRHSSPIIYYTLYICVRARTSRIMCVVSVGKLWVRLLTGHSFSHALIGVCYYISGSVLQCTHNKRVAFTTQVQ